LLNKSEQGCTILIIDDELNILELLERVLKSEGYNVLSAADGVYGISLLKEHKPDLILLDIVMPGPDGFTVLDNIRKDSDVPVIMITAKRDTESLNKALNLGADDYIKKPFRPSELVARVHAKLRRIPE